MPVMANGGFLIDPYFISKIENDQGGVIFEAKPKIACPECDIPVIYGNTQKIQRAGKHQRGRGRGFARTAKQRCTDA
ncbi:penicillin-binding protein 1A [Salmonella enterica subsp. arizonae]|nr:penicillin-binding protein 1A [Salmonella enterica subsp. arizonae]